VSSQTASTSVGAFLLENKMVFTPRVYIVFEQNCIHNITEMYIATYDEIQAIQICADNNELNKAESVDVYYYYEEVQLTK
jgi:hypothetical protein